MSREFFDNCTRRKLEKELGMLPVSPEEKDRMMELAVMMNHDYFAGTVKKGGEITDTEEWKLLPLLFAYMNLKELAIWKWRKGGLRKASSFVRVLEPIYLYIKSKMVSDASHPEPFCLQSELPK